MLVVKIELWPGGNKERAKEIGRTYIANTGGTAKRGDYKVAVCHKNSNFEEIPKELRKVTIGTTEDYIDKGKKAMRSGDVFNYPKLSYNVWRLVLRALKVCFKEEK